MHGHLHLHAQTYVWVHTYMDGWMHGQVYACACMAMHEYMSTHSYEHAHIGTYIDIWMHVWIYACTDIPMCNLPACLHVWVYACVYACLHMHVGHMYAPMKHECTDA